MEWLKNLSNAIAYVENNLDREISYEEAAKIACCSAYYFQRMFSCIVGISLSDYIRRRRMTQAAFELQSTGGKVLDVALKYGYTSPTSFNRAFQNVHGICPVAAKKKGTVLNAYPPMKLAVQVTGGNTLPYRLEEKEPMRLIGIRMPLTADMDKNQRLVPSFWHETLQGNQYDAICKQSNQAPHGVLGVTAYLGPNEIYYYIAVATNEAAPAGMFKFEIPAATWVIFEMDGDFKLSMQRVFKRFLTEWLPFSGYVHAQLPDIEVYPIGKNTQKSGHSEVWIALKKKEK